MWLILAVSSYFINAGVYVADKFMLSKKVHSSIAYAFFVGIWSIFNFILLPLDFWVPSFGELMLDLSGGLLFLFTLIFWYKALHQSEATRVVPIVGALVPIFTLILSALLLGDTLDEAQLLAFIILIAGGVLISFKQTRFYMLKEFWIRTRNVIGRFYGSVHAETQPTQRIIVNSVVSSFCFAAYYVLMKYIYMNQPFVGSFVWSRLGTFVGVLLLLLVPAWRASIFHKQHTSNTSKHLGFFILVRILAALAFIMLNWAISFGNVALINSLQGVQFLFLIFMVLIISLYYPKILEEELGKRVIVQKLIGVILVSLGLYILILK